MVELIGIFHNHPYSIIIHSILICILVHYMFFFLKNDSAVAAVICYFSIHLELFDCSVARIFNANCNLYEPRLINDSHISVRLRPLLWEISLFTTPLGQWPLLITETMICMTLNLSIMFYISEMQMSHTIVWDLTVHPHQLCCLRFEVWSITPILAL